jgi:hypothetical protein
MVAIKAKIFDAFSATVAEKPQTEFPVWDLNSGNTTNPRIPNNMIKATQI